jgi:hypothetical protein
VLEELLEEDSVDDEVDIKDRDGAALTLTAKLSIKHRLNFCVDIEQ